MGAEGVEMKLLVSNKPKLSKEELRVLTRFLDRLCDENGWLNAKWIDEAPVHEIAVIHGIHKKLAVML